jgi:hypothetical protein
MRLDYIEPDYVNGVQDEKGNLVIPPLDEEAKRFLNRYYEEVINANFLHDKELKAIHNKMKPLKKKMQLTLDEESELDYLQFQYFERADEVLLYADEEDQRKVYGENNARNRCIYNRSKAAGMLDGINVSTFNEESETNTVCPESGEKLAIDKQEHQRKYILRKKSKKL